MFLTIALHNEEGEVITATEAKNLGESIDEMERLWGLAREIKDTKANGIREQILSERESP